MEVPAEAGYDATMRFLLAIAVAAATLLPLAALAQDRQQAPTLKTEIDGETIAIPTPFGYCDLDPAEPRGSRPAAPVAVRRAENLAYGQGPP